MPNPTPQPRKRREDKLDWEDLEAAPNVEGMYSYLKGASDTRYGESLPRETPPRVAPPGPTRTAYVPGVGKRRFHYCQTAQEAHTPGEQTILNALYTLSRDRRWGIPEASGAILVGVSMARLAEITGLHETNIRVNLRGLTEKLAIELVANEDRRQQTPRRYRVYMPAQILDRRRAAGLEWVVKNHGVRFVGHEEMTRLLASEALPGK